MRTNKSGKGVSSSKIPKVDLSKATVDEVIYYYAFVFDLSIELVLSMTKNELEELAYMKAVIENWKNNPK